MGWRSWNAYGGGVNQTKMTATMDKIVARTRLVDGKPTRVRFETRPDGSKVRVAVRGGKDLHVLRGPRNG